MYPLAWPAASGLVPASPPPHPEAPLPASSILLLDSDAAAAERISTALSGVGYTVQTVADADEAFRRAGDHNLVILDVVVGDRTALDVCREIRGTPALAAIPVLCISQSDEVEERIRFLEAGADDVMAKPFDARELEARVEALLLRFQRTRDLTPVLTGDGIAAAPRARRTVVVFSPKGGAGTTTIATNIAIALAERHPDRVVLVDLDLQFGQVATHLNLEVTHSLADVVRDEASLREPELLRTYATRHGSGLHVLAAPPTPELAEFVQPAQVGQLLETVLETYDAVVVDAGSSLDERTMTAFERADAVLLAVVPEMGALKAVHTLLDYLAEAGSVGAKTTFVLNNLFAREILRTRDVESALGSRIAVELPYDPFLYLKAVNEGVPIVAGSPRSTAAERLVKLSSLAFGEVEVAGSAATAAPARRHGLLASLRRR